MRKAILLGVMAVVFSVAAGQAWADLNEQAVAKVAKLLAEKKEVGERLGTYPNLQWIAFEGTVTYLIDPQAQLCFTAHQVPVPCKALKKGYPLIAPLITWDD